MGFLYDYQKCCALLLAIIPNVLLNISPFFPHNTKRMLNSVLQEWSLTFLQYPTILTPIRAIQDIGVGHEKAELTKTLPSCQDS